MSTIIPINDDLRIELDGHSWAIARRYGRSWHQALWYSRLTSLLADTLLKEAGRADLEGVEAVLAALEKYAAQFIAAVERSPYEDIHVHERQRIGEASNDD